MPTPLHIRAGMAGIFVVLITSLACGQTSPARGRLKNSALRGQSAKEQPAGITPAELARLRPVVERDLVEGVKRVWNIEKPTAADLDSEFQSCRFTPLRLGKLGPAVLVEDPGLGREMPMVNIYAPSRGAYRLLIKEAGTGATILPGPAPAPDIIFGTSGVCYSLWRYRYIGGKYQYDACLRREQDAQGNCVVKSCNKPAFKDPFEAASSDQQSNAPPAPSPYVVGPGLTAREIMGGKD